ncbi:MAG: MATE family efflux transporter [Oscillospiraceae bacterium]|nr:MATE family efflux transporter [Oscillospiraceae bacterium]
MLSALRQKPGFYRYLLSLSLPIVLQNLISTSLGFVDTFMVGLLGSNQLSAVTAANSLLFLLQIVIFGLTSGLALLVSQHWGQGDLHSISRAVGVVMYAAIGIVGTVAIFFFCCPQKALSIVTDNTVLIQLGAPYLKIAGVSYLFNAISSVYVSMERSVENPKLGTVVYATSVSMNTVLNYCLIFGKFGFEAYGIKGAAIATLISRLAEVTIVAVYFCTKRKIPVYIRELLSPGFMMVKSFLKYSTLILFNEFMWGLGQTVFTTILGHTAASADMLAAFAVMSNIDKMATVACYGLADATAIILGKSIGAGLEKEHIYKLGCCLLAVAVILGGCISVVLAILLPVFFRPVLFPLFQLNEFAFYTVTCMCIAYLIQMPCRSFNNSVITGVLRSGGDIKAAIAVDLIPLWLIAIPITALLALHMEAAVPIICVGIYCENVCKMPLGIIRVKSKKWINNITQTTKS